MNSVKIYIENQLEWSDIKNVLESNNISYRIRDKQKSTFTNSNNESLEIIIAHSDLKSFNALTANKYNALPMDHKISKRMSFGKMLLYAYAFLMTVMAVKFYFQSRALSEAKNVSLTWSYDNTQLVQRWKETNAIQSVFTDENFDLNWEMVESFINGRKSSVSYDFDENGIVDKLITFDVNGDTTSISLDVNQDEWIDESFQILENGDTLIFIDSNNNGLWELK